MDFLCVQCRNAPGVWVEAAGNGRRFCSGECQSAFYAPEIGVHLPTEDAIRAKAAELHQKGFCVLRVYETMEAHDIMERLKDALFKTGGMPEYKVQGAKMKLVPGKGFALGNPSSFHLPVVRQIRSDVQRVAGRMFLQYAEQSDRHRDPLVRLEQIPNQLMVLQPGDRTAKEGWHRGGFKKVLHNDDIFGGFIVFGRTHLFSAKAGSHLHAVDEAPDIEDLEAEKLQELELHPGGWYTHVRHGELLIYHRDLLREFAGGLHELETEIRLAIGWRLTKSPKPILEDWEEWFTQQAVPKIDGQTPVMWPRTQWRKDRRLPLAEWSRRMFYLCLLQNEFITQGPDKGHSFRIIPEHMYSLYYVAAKRAAEARLREGKFSAHVDAICNSKPSEWDKQNLDVSSIFTPEELARYMMPPYEDQDKYILRPLLLKKPNPN